MLLNSALQHTKERFALLLSLLLLLSPAPLTAQEDSTRAVPAAEEKTPFPGRPVFPVYSAIADNVQFWKDIYLKRKNNEVVVHDAGNPARIYEVITLIEAGLPGARKMNIYREKKAREKYEKLLKKLSTQKPQSKEEKRVAALFPGKNPRGRMKLAAKRVRLQGGQQRRFRLGVIRSGRYIDRIKEIFKAHGVPEDLAYLPMVESSYHNGAYSKVGASGIWQFTRTTGTRYLIIDSAVDERLDPLTASRAAAEYLVRSYKHLQQWPLTVTSYNYGLPGTIRAYKQYGSYSDVFRRHSTTAFQFASRNFYSEFVAAVDAAKVLEKSLKRSTPVPTVDLKLTGYVTLRDLARYFNLPDKTLKEYNPALRPAAFKGVKRVTKGYVLHLPDSPQMREKRDEFPSILYFRGQKRIRHHRVRKGESAGRIASRYGVSLKALRRANRLNRKSTIRVGQQLLIPDNKNKNANRWALYQKQLKQQALRRRPLERGSDGIPILRSNRKHLRGKTKSGTEKSRTNNTTR